MRIDTHIHIGQFKEIYYNPLEIVETVISFGIQEMWFSSCSSCIENIRYVQIEREIQNLLTNISYSQEIVHPFLWYIPDYINQGISVENPFNSIPYKGIKLHPFAHDWNFEDGQHKETLHSLFDYAAKNNLPVLIHTGESGIDNADRFEIFFKEYKTVHCILAHCRPLDITISMLKKYSNVFCDTAFVPETHIKKIISAGYRGKIFTGTDFPITHYYSENQYITLREQYKLDIALIDNLLI